ncbi:hypothetical protein [Shimia thalassica]|uniref:hypothetical protein n=1 Tax=Shimia thalassica TaxID=1715693 RepID=UPI0026E18458|nr:hypothetical protein [Shimia thalassica]MDO6483570.1 hypothetical protein [Shimia thalassica]
MSETPVLSETVRIWLLNNGFLPEVEVAAMRGEKVATTVDRRRRGKMPPHKKFGGLIVYSADDILNEISKPNLRDPSTTAVARKALAKSVVGGGNS